MMRRALYAVLAGALMAATIAAVGLSSPVGAVTAQQTPPTVTITVPADSAVYRQGQVVDASYSCAAATSITSCTGDVADGAALNTTTVGPHLFKVAAVDSSGNPTTVAHAYRVISGTPTVIGPTDVGALTGGPQNLSGAKATVKISAPAASGGQLGVGDTIKVEWSLYRAKLGLPYIGNNGPNPLTWTFPAAPDTAIEGPVTVDEKGLHGETASQAFGGSGATGVTSITPANPVDASQLVVNFDDDSSPGLTGDGDGVLEHVTFTLKVTAPGTITVPGFPALTGKDCAYEGLDCNTFTTGTGIGGTGVSFQAIDSIAPSITINTPAQGALIEPNTPTNADYSCSDAATLCQGDVADGSPIDTSTSGPHQLHVTAADANGNLAQSWSTYVVDDPTVSVADCSSDLGFSCAFPVTLTNPSSKGISMHYATADGTATAASGAYTATSGLLTFAPGVTTHIVNVPVPTTGHAGTFSLVLSNPNNVYLADGGSTATGTIAGPPPTASIADASIERPSSGTSPLDFTVTLSSPALAPVSIAYATTNGTATGLIDYTPTSGTLTIDAGQSSGQIAVPILGSQNDDPDETFTLTLSSPQQATLSRSVATGTITANDELAGCSPGDTAVQRYVCHVYLDALGRAADVNGKAYWVNLIDNGATHSRMATLYFNTAEARRVQVDRLYVLYLGRHGDASGVSYWAGKLDHGGTPDDVRVFLLSSGEYYTKSGGTNSGFISQMYTDVLRRTVDPGGLAYWTGQLNSGVSRAAAAKSFLHTSEGREAVISDVYLRFLRRIPGTSETTYWVTAFTHGKTEVDIDIQVVASNEYFNRT